MLLCRGRDRPTAGSSVLLWRPSDSVPLPATLDRRNSSAAVTHRTATSIPLNRADAQRQSAQQALQESELRYRSIVDATFDGIVISENGVVRWGNPGLATMFGYDAGEMLGRPIVEFLTPESRALVIENIRAGKEGAWKITGRHKEGRAIFLEIVVKEHAVNGKQVRVAALRDITERHKLEEQIRQSSKMESLGRVAGGVAHDFNNLLMVINGHSDLIIKRAPAADPLLPSMLAIRKAGIRATALTQHLLAFSRKQVLDKKVIDVNGAVQESINMLRRVIPENIELAADLTPLPCSIEADPRHIDQLLMNLVVNARDAMPAGGLLRLETRIVELDEAALRGHPDVKAGVFVQLTVRDTGTGIDPQVLPHIFEPFFTTKDESHGTGLGLSTVFGEVNQAGGFITVETELGVGTAFHVCLPRLHGKDVAEPPRPESASSAGGQTILLVEDQLEVLNLVRMMLQSFGYKVHAASAAGDALRIAQTEKIHLLLTDVVMPDMGGPELAAAIRQQSPGIKTVFMSGYPKDSFPGQTAGDDNVAFLQKPVSAEALAAKIREVLGSS
ncbi:MAG: response regulator [Candidatus Solibacter usitatus]|nr:response regulator [Candidatus Solibacter usitatus]